MRIKQACSACGCDSFWLYIDPDQKGRISFECQGCRCQRHISTPGVGVLKYELCPATVSADTPRSEPMVGSLEAQGG